MRVVETESLDFSGLDPETALWVYNGLDACITEEILPEIKSQLDEHSSTIYSFERALQAPALEMMLRGLPVNEAKRAVMRDEFEARDSRLREILNTLAQAVWGRPLNPNSPKQLKEFFYGVMKIPEVTVYDKGTRRVSTNREALEKIEAYFYAKPIVRTITSIRDNLGVLKVLRKGVDSDSRIRTSYNIGGTETGRWSSSFNAFGTGDNLQNWTEEVRRVICAHEGWKFSYVDLETAESLATAYLSGDPSYIDACETGDVHTAVARLVWPDLDWTGDLAKDKALAETPYYRHFTRRFMCKKGGHGSNYYGKPFTIAKHMKVETEIVEGFQATYFGRFPGIPAWHKEIGRRLSLDGYIVTPFGRKRYFFGRTNDDATLREAIAYGPQSLVADALNLGLYKLWQKIHQEELPIQILAQVHDAVLITYPEEFERRLIPVVCQTLPVSVPVNGRVLTIPAEASVGWNWEKQGDTNPDGLRKWSGNDSRERQEYPAEAPTLLDRLVS